MRFVHIADVHFDAPFTTLASKGFSETRRLEQRNTFKKVIDYIKTNEIEYLFICGDLYEQEYIKESTVRYINGLFDTIPSTKIFIVPGNHDPYIKNSYYKTFEFSKNVKIFTGNLEKIDDGDINIYGYGFEDFYMQSGMEDKIYIEDKYKINILLTHCDLDGAANNEMRYNPVLKSKLKALEFDYIGLGHIHKLDYTDNIVYPGSLTSLGFDELRTSWNDISEK